MAIIPLKAWYLERYEPIRDLVKRPQDLRLNKNSLLKSGLRADFLDDSQTVQESIWFKRYLEGEKVEFYIQGSGNYAIANIDIISQEIYFTKQEMMAGLEPIVYFSYQTEYPDASEALTTALNEAIANINTRSRLPLTLEISPRPTDNPLRLSSSQFRQIAKSLLFVADVTPIASIATEDRSQLLLSPNVCVEIGYALERKDPAQLLLIDMKRQDLQGEFPFDRLQHQQLSFETAAELNQTLPPILQTLLQRFTLFS